MEEKLKALIQQRGAVKGKLTRVKTAITQRVGELNPNLRKVNFLKLHLETVKTCYTEFNTFQNEIYALGLSEKQKEEHENKYEEFELLHNLLVVELNDLLDEVSKPVVNAALVSVPAANVALPNYLPPLSVPLPKFDGTYATWYSFKSMFQTIMARYTNEAPAIKLYHLRDALVGKAAGVIDQDIVNNNDYDAAWAILEEIYGDKRVVIDHHIANIFALPKIASDNAVELRKLIDTCAKNIEGLKSLQLPVNGLGEQMLVNLLASRMDIDTRRAWEAQQKVGELPTYAATIAFLKERCRVLERVESCGEPSVKPQRSVALVVESGTMCPVCYQQHEFDDCEQFNKMSVNERYNQLCKHGRCFNCLKKGHRAGECTSTNTCQSCGKLHHILLHKNATRKPGTTPKMTAVNTPKSNDEQRWRSGQGLACSTETKKSALLSTAVVQVYGGDGAPHQCRVLIDSCSENNFVTERFANQLAVKKERTDCEVSGLNGGCTRINHLVQATIKSRVTSFSRKLELMVTPKIIHDAPPRNIDVADWKLPSNIELADPTFYQTGPVDMLLGAGVFWDLLKAGRIALADGLPSLRETEFGWPILTVVCGFEKYDLHKANQWEKILLLSLIVLMFFITQAYEIKLLSMMISRPATKELKTLAELRSSGVKIKADFLRHPGTKNNPQLENLVINGSEEIFNMDMVHAYVLDREWAKVVLPMYYDPVQRLQRYSIMEQSLGVYPVMFMLQKRGPFMEHFRASIFVTIAIHLGVSVE
ncbi:uncharacterized protein LOC120423482 [Culex pipiens pallens]|uniref:uncharacterized protein LOC120423482 n=1 Tax=Culex pipiens pallens TaxID=42434 RepID=UPI0022AA5563|nr:uncharacterized protein LOC120423482 [Culex pipiens pallens]